MRMWWKYSSCECTENYCFAIILKLWFVLISFTKNVFFSTCLCDKYPKSCTAWKACFENFYKKVSRKLIGNNVDKCYNCLIVLFFIFKEALTYFKFKDFA